MPDENIKSHPGTAAVLSFVFNGLGQLYNGQINKGLLIMFFSAVGMLALIMGSILAGLWLLGKIAGVSALILCGGLFLIGLALICIFGIYSIKDAYDVAAKK